MTIDFSKYYQPKPKQLEVHASRAKYILYGGSLGSGKSWVLCAEAIRNAMQFKGNRLVIVRKELSVMRRTIIPTFFKICPKEIIKSFNQTSLEVKFINGSNLIFMEANVSKDSLLNKLKGLEIGWFGIDEANEVSKEVYYVLKTRLRWVLPSGDLPRYEGRLTSNPENCWLIGTFLQSNNPNEIYIKALTTDNYSADSEYIKNLEEAFKDNPQMLQKYLYADWSATDSINQLIPSKIISDCENHVGLPYEFLSMGVDVARFGDDQTVFTILKNGNIEHIESHPKTSIPEVVSRTIELIHQFNINPYFVGVDSVGLGAGVIDYLKQQGYFIVEIIGGAAPLEQPFNNEIFKPANLKTQMYLELSKDMRESTIGNIKDQKLIYELASIKYEVLGEKTVRVLPKKVIKQLLGKSPDFADSLAIANWCKNARSTNNILLPFG